MICGGSENVKNEEFAIQNDMIEICVKQCMYVMLCYVLLCNVCNVMKCNEM